MMRLSVPDLTATHALSNCCPLHTSLFDQTLQVYKVLYSLNEKDSLQMYWDQLESVLSQDSRFNDGIETDFFQLGWLKKKRQTTLPRNSLE